MANKEIGPFPGNKWFDAGMTHLAKIDISKEISINVFSAPYFLASKFDAFHDRGGNPLFSKDFEDVVYILNNRQSIASDIKESPKDVRQYLKAELRNIYGSSTLMQGIMAHSGQDGRFSIIKNRIFDVIGSDNS